MEQGKLWPNIFQPSKTIKKNTNSTQNKSQTHRAKQYEVTSFLSTDCELSTETCSKNGYSLGPKFPGKTYRPICFLLSCLLLSLFRIVTSFLHLCLSFPLLLFCSTIPCIVWSLLKLRCRCFAHWWPYPWQPTICQRSANVGPALAQRNSEYNHYVGSLLGQLRGAWGRGTSPSIKYIGAALTRFPTISSSNAIFWNQPHE